MNVKNINPAFGDEIEFSSISEMESAIEASGYAVPDDELKEGRDFIFVK